MAEQSQPLETPRRRVRPETSAWLLLLLFFMIFCALVAGAGILGWRYYTFATMRIDELPRGGRVRVHAAAGVGYQAKDSMTLRTPTQVCPDNPPGINATCADLKEGDRVKAVPEAGYGPVASIKLPDETQIDLWAHPTGADLTLTRYRITRWTSRRQEVALQQTAGYARYDIPAGQGYDEVNYSVTISTGVNIVLAPGGSYSINVPREEPGPYRAMTDGGEPMLLEVAVRDQGRAAIHSMGQVVVVEPGLRAQVDETGMIYRPVAARWQLIRDGDFTGYEQQQHYSPGVSATWSIYRNAGALEMTEEEKNGTFTVVQSCRPRLEIITTCSSGDQAYIGQFRRVGNQTKNFVTGIEQELDVDVSEFTSLRLLSWTRVVTQTVADAGVEGSECPIMIWLTYKTTSPADDPGDRWICVYAVSGAAATGSNNLDRTNYKPVNAFQWYPIDLELRNDPLLTEARYLQKIRIEARGHDYVSEITGIQLIGTQ